MSLIENRTCESCNTQCLDCQSESKPKSLQHDAVRGLIRLLERLRNRCVDDLLREEISTQIQMLEEV